MAIVELEISRVSLGGAAATLSVTFDDTNDRLQDLIIRNPLADPLTVWGLLELNNGSELYRETIVDGGETVFNIPGNRRMVDVIDDDGATIKSVPFSVSFGAMWSA